MLNNTYIHIPGVGKNLEQKIWAQGIHKWEEFLEMKETMPIPSTRKARICEEISLKGLLFFFSMSSFCGTLESLSRVF
jgi:uncharacterized protein YprB with RNaseH-like and TPR domain